MASIHARILRITVRKKNGSSGYQDAESSVVSFNANLATLSHAPLSSILFITDIYRYRYRSSDSSDADILLSTVMSGTRPRKRSTGMIALVGYFVSFASDLDMSFRTGVELHALNETRHEYIEHKVPRRKHARHDTASPAGLLQSESRIISLRCAFESSLHSF
jgi:hypothetical protein